MFSLCANAMERIILVQQYTGPHVLPVTFTGFTATGVDHTSLLQWQVAEQVNTDHYEIEASTRCNNYSTMEGTGYCKRCCQLISLQMLILLYQSLNYYRIKEVDKDGSSIYSPVRFVKFDATVLTISPNPAA